MKQRKFVTMWKWYTLEQTLRLFHPAFSFCSLRSLVRRELQKWEWGKVTFPTVTKVGHSSLSTGGWVGGEKGRCTFLSIMPE